jgi:penicillin-binding protein 1B
MAVVNSALIDVTRYGTAKRLSGRPAIQVAGKTGTSDDLRDSWFAGFSGDVLAVVWTGFDDNSSTLLTGSSGAMKIWQDIISKVAYQPYELPEMPQLTREWIDVKSGLLTENGCENAVQLVFIKGTQPQEKNECAAARGSNWFLDLFN